MRNLHARTLAFEFARTLAIAWLLTPIYAAHDANAADEARDFYGAFLMGGEL